MTTLVSTSTIGEINAALELGTATLEEAAAILRVRAARKDSKSAVRAQAWLQAHDLAPVKARAKATVKANTPKVPKGPRKTKHGRTRDGRPVSEVAWALRGELRAQGIERTYADCIEAVKVTLV